MPVPALYKNQDIHLKFDHFEMPKPVSLVLRWRDGRRGEQEREIWLSYRRVCFAFQTAAHSAARLCVDLLRVRGDAALTALSYEPLVAEAAYAEAPALAGACCIAGPLRAAHGDWISRPRPYRPRPYRPRLP
jgi:hypothetical protein